MSELILARDIEQRIFLVRGQKVMIDRDLAELYKVPTFVLNRLRQWALTHEDLARKIAVLEGKFKSHDRSIRTIFEALRELIDPPESPRVPIGFRSKS